MAYTLGLDLGSSSIGWAIIDTAKDSKAEIVAMGSRILPLTTDDKDEFVKGNTITKNGKRTQRRTQRKGQDRYQLRRKYLIEALKSKDMLPDDATRNLKKMQLWETRAKAATEQVSLKELGRILLHLNQKRGYKSSRSEANMDKKDTEYVAEIKNRYDHIKELDYTIGQYFYKELQAESLFKVKTKIFPREAYIAEFDTICATQRKFYPEVLTSEFIAQLRNEIIYYQRALKSQKGLVSVCDFEGVWREGKDGKEYFTGPKVAPKASLLFQVERLWEIVNNIKLTNKRGDAYEIPLEKKQQLFTHLDNNAKLSFKDLLKILGLKAIDGWYGNQMLSKGIEGNPVKIKLQKCFSKETLKAHPELLSFEVEILQEDWVDPDTGETIQKPVIDNDKLESQTSYKLWHIIYSIPDTDVCRKVLLKEFPYFSEEEADKLSRIDFVTMGYGNKSAKMMRKILPYLMDGYLYSDACAKAGYNHSNSLTNEQRDALKLEYKLESLPKNSLRQPIVEKILNQMINLVNALVDKYGSFENIRVELARELKQSREERSKTYSSNTIREREAKFIATSLEEMGIRATRNNILKKRLYQEINDGEPKFNGYCIYCGQTLGQRQTFFSSEVDIEHIIPKARLFDDSQSNKTLAHRSCNATKGNRTAYDFMKETKSPEEFEGYLERVNSLFDRKLINKAKRDKLLMPSSKIPDDFIERQLRESQYIAKKAVEILSKICRNVNVTGGGITAYLREIWGWNDVLMNLQLPKYKQCGQTEMVEWERAGTTFSREEIKGWTKRDDQRHHAVDALVIACTKQSYIQRINTLNASENRSAMKDEIADRFNTKKSLLENYIYDNKPFTTAEVEQAADKILVSYKPGKKVATKGVRRAKVDGDIKVVQTGVVIPRGSLSEESIYGKVKQLQKNIVLKNLFESPERIVKKYIQDKVMDRLAMYDGDKKKAAASVKKDPIWLDKEQTKPLEYASCYIDEIVIRKPVSSIGEKQLDDVIDLKVREILQERLAKYKGKDAYKDLENDPIWYNKDKGIKIETVRCKTGLSAIVPVRYNENGEGDAFVKPGNNHHIAIYQTSEGKLEEHSCTFWHAVERYKYCIPVVIENTNDVHDVLLQRADELPQSFIDKLPAPNCTLVTSLQQNQMYVLGMADEDFENAIRENDTALLSKYLYRVQNIANADYCFRHHLETSVDKDNIELKRDSKRFYRLKSIKGLFNLNPKKVSISAIGDIYV